MSVCLRLVLELGHRIEYSQSLSATFRFAQRRPFSKGLCFLCSRAAQKQNLFFIPGIQHMVIHALLV